MPSDPPIDPPSEATAAPDPPAEAVVPAPVEPVEPVEAAAPAPAPVVPAPPAEPVSPVKEWAVAVALMIVFAIICAQFITFLRSNPYSGPGP